ncbi:hypothetical protein P154DRAFT_580679 [Amniculicola lignicola CBS 123094]|uniref:Uncharacterized protein n=1 Tax=Amniculicola lignicola CBS 123094 TaxID=1392246 RepID=A0A6A5W3F4_9PLEO|nr:hypothetical protein P154DRAFT_580679 [Amniculicola lignicola CBS 123094]
MLFKTCAVLAIATGFAAAKPIAVPREIAPYPIRRDFTPKRSGFGGNNDKFDFINGFNDVNNQDFFLNIKEENVQIVDNGFQQVFIQQAKEVVIVNQQENGFNNQLNNLFRKSSYSRNFNDVSTVLMVVQQVDVFVDDGFGNQISSSLFAQSVVVANRGNDFTQSVMIFEAQTLNAQNFFDGGNGIGGGIRSIPTATGNFVNASFPTQTADVQLFGARPTWTDIAEDPAATLGGIWQRELEDLANFDNNKNDNDLNALLAQQELQQLLGFKA